MADQQEAAREFKPHYSVKATARELKTSERRVRKAMEQGDLRYVMFGGRPIIPGSEVQRLAEAVE
jgi:hypothetical protein